MDVVFVIALMMAMGFGIIVGGLAAVHFAEWLDEHGPKSWPGRY